MWRHPSIQPILSCKRKRWATDRPAVTTAASEMDNEVRAAPAHKPTSGAAETQRRGADSADGQIGREGRSGSNG